MQFLDLIQEGNMRHMAVDRNLTTLKVSELMRHGGFVKQSLVPSPDQARTIRIPVHMVETINKWSVNSIQPCKLGQTQHLNKLRERGYDSRQVRESWVAQEPSFS